MNNVKLFHEYTLKQSINISCFITACCHFLQGFEIELSGEGEELTLDAPMDIIPLHIRGGYILPTQEFANTTVFR